MDYSDALRVVKAGGRVARRSWVEPGKYIYWTSSALVQTPDGKSVERVGHALFFRPFKGENGQVEPWLPSFDAQAADDWYDIDAEE